MENKYIKIASIIEILLGLVIGGLGAIMFVFSMKHPRTYGNYRPYTWGADDSLGHSFDYFWSKFIEIKKMGVVTFNNNINNNDCSLCCT